MYLPKVLVFSDHILNGECLFALLSNFRSIQVQQRISTFEEGKNYQSKSDIDILIMELGEDVAFDQLREFVKSFRSSKKMVLTNSRNHWFLSALIHSGINGIFFTSANSKQLSEALSTFSKENWYLPEEVAEEFSKDQIKINSVGNGSYDLHHPTVGLPYIDLQLLTNREMDILKLMALGESSSSIADSLFISELTVNTHRKHILKKLGLSNTPTLIRCVVEQGIV